MSYPNNSYIPPTPHTTYTRPRRPLYSPSNSASDSLPNPHTTYTRSHRPSHKSPNDSGNFLTNPRTKHRRAHRPPSNSHCSSNLYPENKFDKGDWQRITIGQVAQTLNWRGSMKGLVELLHHGVQLGLVKLEDRPPASYKPEFFERFGGKRRRSVQGSYSRGGHFSS
jgi:hypothetical protein